MSQRRNTAPLLWVLIFALFGSSCVSSKRAKKGNRGFEQSGIASWYGPGFHGRTTANGEKYDMEAMTAAHKQLPFGSIVEVKNRDNGRKTQVRINDRGPFVRGRIIDLSKAAARDIDMLGSGIARVKIRVVGRSGRSRSTTGSLEPVNPAKPGNPAGYTVQAGAFRDRERAEARLAAVRVHFPRGRIASSGGLHRVLLSDLSKKAAEEAARTLRNHDIEALVLE